MKLRRCSDTYLNMAHDSFELSDSEVVWLVADQTSCFAAYPDFLKERFGTGYRFTKRQVVAERCKRAFKAEYELGEEDFATIHWQTLFAIQYPEARK